MKEIKLNLMELKNTFNLELVKEDVVTSHIERLEMFIKKENTNKINVCNSLFSDKELIYQRDFFYNVSTPINFTYFLGVVNNFFENILDNINTYELFFYILNYLIKKYKK